MFIVHVHCSLFIVPTLLLSSLMIFFFLSFDHLIIICGRRLPRWCSERRRSLKNRTWGGRRLGRKTKEKKQKQRKRGSCSWLPNSTYSCLDKNTNKKDIAGKSAREAGPWVGRRREGERVAAEIPAPPRSTSPRTTWSRTRSRPLRRLLPPELLGFSPEILHLLSSPSLSSLSSVILLRDAKGVGVSVWINILKIFQKTVHNNVRMINKQPSLAQYR